MIYMSRSHAICVQVQSRAFTVEASVKDDLKKNMQNYSLK